MGAWLMVRTERKTISFLTPSGESWGIETEKKGEVNRQKEDGFGWACDASGKGPKDRQQGGE